MTGKMRMLGSRKYLIAVGQDFYSTTTIKPQSSTTKADIPDLILFYASPVITLIILILLVACLTHSIRSCQRKFARTPTPTLPTISAIVQNGTDADPPPPYTFTDVTQDVSKSEVSVSNCPPYTKDPPTYLELTVSPQMTQS
ncbi:uncharacterized protein LOC110459084 isoform X2 [Mizuhopecten yessoensis]|uniref:uncharacterized protein LOC110459084 isoform X2 n=1 Tax=Mizuhopecten yessoensis TaxID=6573 RepID=UPI000B45B6AA|nr:uncharacterized protein LOC110459084 isoform X2 [Mizuhopecten yessoensis]